MPIEVSRLQLHGDRASSPVAATNMGPNVHALGEVCVILKYGNISHGVWVYLISANDLLVELRYLLAVVDLLLSV